LEWWPLALLISFILVTVLTTAVVLVWRNASGRLKQLGRRLAKLPWRLRVKLAWRLTGDDRIPLAVRAIPPLLLLYLAMPLDVVPDFIPILGQLDDVAVVLIALGLVTRFVPIDVIDAHIAALESESLGRGQGVTSSTTS
jgi:uncharacterized membrane protein YkvA (DUF1232 family)